MSSVSNLLFGGVVTIMFSYYHQMFCRPGNISILAIRFKVFDWSVRIYNQDNDMSLLSYDEEAEEGIEIEDEDDQKLKLE